MKLKIKKSIWNRYIVIRESTSKKFKTLSF